MCLVIALSQYMHTEMNSLLGWITQKDLITLTRRMVRFYEALTQFSFALFLFVVLFVSSACTMNGEAFLGGAMSGRAYWDGALLRSKSLSQGVRYAVD